MNTLRRLGFMSILVLAGLPQLKAQTPDWTRVHEITMRGVNLIYNLEMERAYATFDSVVAMAPGDPRGYFFRNMVRFWTYSLTQNDRDFEQFIAGSDTVVDICDGLIRQNEKDAVARFYLGGIRGYRGLAQQLHGSMVKAVLEGRKGYAELEEAVRLQPNLYDAHMGFGLFRYLVAKTPRGLGWVVGLLGFEGDLEGGLASLRLAATQGVYTRSEASFFLSQFLMGEHRRDEAFALMRSLIQKHPDNTLFLVLYSSWQLREGNLDEALHAIQKATEVNARKTIKYGEEYLFSTKASIAYMRNDFAAAREGYDRFLNQHILRNAIPNYTFYRIATARDIMGDRKGAKEICGMMKEPDDARENEAYLFRRSRELAARPLTISEIRMIMAANALSRKDSDSAATYYRMALEAAGTDVDLQVRSLYGMQQLLYDQKKDTEAIALGERIVTLKPTRETWILPHAYLKLAQSYARLGRTGEATKALDATEQFDDFEFQRSLADHVKEEREKLEEKGRK